MRIFLLALLFPAGLLAAEFDLDGKHVTSKVVEKTVTCNSFSVIITSENFPAKYEMRIPKEFSIKGFYGGDFIIGAEAYFVRKEAKYRLPYANEVSGLKDHLRKATYIPTDAQCTKDGFYVQYWSGGNGQGAEASIDFSVSNLGQISSPLWFTESEFLNLYAK